MGNLHKYNGNDLRRLARKLNVVSPHSKEHLIEAITRRKLGKDLLYGEDKLENDENNRYILNRNKDSEVKNMSDDKNKLDGEKTKMKLSKKERFMKAVRKLSELKAFPEGFKFDREEANER